MKGTNQMTAIYKSSEGERLVRERYQAFLKQRPSTPGSVRFAQDPSRGDRRGFATIA
jgi:hypothetical protein